MTDRAKTLLHDIAESLDGVMERLKPLRGEPLDDNAYNAIADLQDAYDQFCRYRTKGEKS